MDGLMEEVRERILRKGVRWAEEFLRASDEAAGSSVSVGKLGDAPPERDSSPECVPPSPTAPAPASGVGRCYTKDSVIRKGAAGGTRAQPPAAARSLREASASVSRAGRAKRGPASSIKVATHYNDAFVRGRAGRVSYEPALPSVSNIQVVKGRAGRVSYEPALPSVSNVQVVRGRAGRVSYEPALPSVSNVQVPVLCHAPSSPTESVISLNVSRDLLEEGDDTLLESDQEQLFPSDVMSVDAALEQHPVKNVHDLRSVLSSTIADNKSGKAANVRGRRRAMADASVTPASKKVCEPRASRTRRPSLRDNAECPVPSREGSCSRSSHRSASPYRSSQGVTPQVPSDVERCRRVLLQSASQAQGSVQVGEVSPIGASSGSGGNTVPRETQTSIDEKDTNLANPPANENQTVPCYKGALRNVADRILNITELFIAPTISIVMLILFSVEYGTSLCGREIILDWSLLLPIISPLGATGLLILAIFLCIKLTQRDKHIGDTVHYLQVRTRDGPEHGTQCSVVVEPNTAPTPSSEKTEDTRLSSNDPIVCRPGDDVATGSSSINNKDPEQVDNDLGKTRELFAVDPVTT